MHEHTQKHSVTVQGSSDRSFGLVFAVAFLTLGLYPLVGGGAIRIWSLATGAAFFVLALAVPKVLAVPNRLWMKFGLLLQHIVSPIALGALFFLAFMPIGILMRLFGKDSLRLRFDPTANSYWIKRDPPGPDPQSLNNQF